MSYTAVSNNPYGGSALDQLYGSGYQQMMESEARRRRDMELAEKKRRREQEYYSGQRYYPGSVIEYPGIGQAQIGEQLGYTQSAGTGASKLGDIAHVPLVSGVKAAQTPAVDVNKEKTTMADSCWSSPVVAVQSYIEKHKEKIITVAAVFLIDHFVFKGKFRVKLEELFEKLVDKLVGAMA